MRIGIVTQFPFPRSRDYRCLRMVRTLTSAGHHVAVLAPEITDAAGLGVPVEVHAPPGGKLLKAAVPFNLFWAGWIAAQVRRSELDCVLAKNLRLALPALIAARRCGVRSWIDLSENYPAMVSVERSGELLAPVWCGAAGFLERYCAVHADLVTVVTESNRRRLIEMGVDGANITVVSNTPEAAMIPDSRTLGHVPSADGRLHMVFIGLLSKVRGVDRLLRAMAQASAGDRAHLHVIGAGPDLERLRRLAADLRLSGAVTFHGWIPKEQFMQNISSFDIGVVSHLISEHTETTIPNKLFEYMACGLPVWTTAMTPCREVVEEAGCGWVSGDDIESLAHTLHAVLATSAEDKRLLGLRGRRAVEERYNWNVDGERMLKAVEDLDGKRSAHAVSGFAGAGAAE